MKKYNKILKIKHFFRFKVKIRTSVITERIEKGNVMTFYL